MGNPKRSEKTAGCAKNSRALSRVCRCRWMSRLVTWKAEGWSLWEENLCGGMSNFPGEVVMVLALFFSITVARIKVEALC